MIFHKVRSFDKSARIRFNLLRQIVVLVKILVPLLHIISGSNTSELFYN